MKQGEIWELYLDPVKESEQAGRRPGVIISGNVLNQYLPIVIICPLTTKIKNYKGNVVLSPNDKNNLKNKSEILTFHIRSVSKSRLKKKLGSITSSELEKIKSGLNDILRY
ncbi:MAG: type II toxin-antitoxin system PemK/MazF family toxin [Bacteroidota bacterium]